MANVRVARVILIGVDAAGNPVEKSKATIKEVMTSSTEHRVVGTDDTIAPNAFSGEVLSYPTVEDYLTAEYADGFRLVHIDQGNIITDDNLNP